MSIRDWLTAYLEALPPSIRGSLDDARLTAAAIRARDSGWAPRHAAAVVAGRKYGGAVNPPLIAIMRLEELAQHPPDPPRPPSRDSDEPASPSIPSEWVAERMALLRRLMNTPGDLMGPDAREAAMRDLIDEQRGRTLG
ncbi:MAG: hypothetical protein WCF04_00150 [Candidatus Nanopelagicales bacterium]